MYASNTHTNFPSSVITIYGSSSYFKYGITTFALFIIFLLISILLFCVTFPENANFKSPSFIERIILSIKFKFKPDFPLYSFSAFSALSESSIG